MSLQEELAELSTVYHGQRAYVEELEQLVKDYHEMIASMPEFATVGDYKRLLQPLQQRAKELLPKA
jgi:hypothetical protein